jgi:hypothetical protein
MPKDNKDNTTQDRKRAKNPKINKNVITQDRINFKYNFFRTASSMARIPVPKDKVKNVQFVQVLARPFAYMRQVYETHDRKHLDFQQQPTI